ncbi:hypothetical protein HUT19_02995 [Streptomyces sp. NA02950]|uniref:hypothetical protein n=1 Tax=Streptomyces sp. NA02950 TaxID=2742137 RepID=UPI00158FB912|nr:hypothetical protein [Streptomyces sp. NA02950]QKV90835.1 hypothetical protein HUT19_02995 [Streptomyces sp. NA02950]
MTAQLTTEEIFEGLDDEVWLPTGFVGGTAADPAGTLRALASDDDEAVREALTSFWHAMRARVPAYTATVQCVPYLARLCVSGVYTETLLELLHSVADGEDQPRGDQDELVAAVAAQVPVLLPLLADEDVDIRRLVVRIIGLSGPSRTSAEAIRERWADETDQGLRSDLLTACRVADADIAAEISAGELGPGRDPEVRLAAALSLVRADGAWTDELAAAATAWALNGTETEPGERWFDPSTGDWKDTDRDDRSFELLLALLADRGELPVALGLLETVATAEGEGAGLRNRRVLAAAETLCGEFRTAPPSLVPYLAALVGDEDAAVAGRALSQLRRLGDEARPAADAVLRVAAGEVGTRGGEREDEELADTALAVLIGLGDPRAVPLLARDLPCRRESLETAVGSSAWSAGRGVVVPFDAGLLDAARDLLRNPDRRNYGAPRYLCTLLSAWGPQAAPALPELYALLPKERQNAPAAVAAAAAGTDDAEEAAERLRAAADGASVYDRMPIAAALHKLTGDSAPLVEAVRAGLDDILYSKRSAVARASRLGAAGEPLLPRLRELLAPEETDGVGWDRGDCLSAASAILAIEGPGAAEELLPVVSAVLAADSRTGAAAARLARRIGAPAASLAPEFAPLFRKIDTLVPACGALMALPGAIGPDGELDQETLTDALVLAVEQGGQAEEAIALLRELGGGSLTPDVTERLRELADATRRPPRHPYDLHWIRADQRRLAVIRAALDG